MYSVMKHWFLNFALNKGENLHHSKVKKTIDFYEKGLFKSNSSFYYFFHCFDDK